MANLMKIKDLANEKNIALKDVAVQANLTPQGLSRMMRLGSTNTETLERIAEILNVSASVFFNDDEKEHTSVCSASQTGDALSTGRDNNVGNANGNNSKVINYPCPDDSNLIKQLQKDVEYLREMIGEKDARLVEKEERIKELKERIEELKKHIK